MIHNDNNLVLKSYQYVFKKLKKTIKPVKITIEQHIPNCGGLGSSANCIVAGVLGANAILGDVLSKEEILNLCVELEGHPDNVLPCLLGGLVSSLKKENGYEYFSYNVSDKLFFTIFIPPFSINTNDARKILPNSYTRENVVYTISHLLPLPKAFEDGNINLLYELMQDVIHDPYRLKLISNGIDLKEWCKVHHLPCVISGSGASMLVISDNENITKEYKTSWQRIVVKKDDKGAIIL